MRNLLFLLLALAAVLGIQHLLAGPGRAYAATEAPPLPAFTQTEPDRWLNSEPLTVESLRGKVVLVDIWARECWNCYRSFPWLNSLEKDFPADQFTIVGIHTPEFEREKDRDALLVAIERYQLHHPVMMDNDYAYWKALNNRFWPAYYLVDGKGRIREVYIGETHEGDAQARRIAGKIRSLMDEL